ncbi:MAG: PEP/pyruvate-binding domain-containing protein [Nitrospirota bacterium]
MAEIERIDTKSGIVLKIEKRSLRDKVEILITARDHRKCLLHWGVRKNRFASWQMPPGEIWPEGSRSFDNAAVQTPFVPKNGEAHINLKIDRIMDIGLIDFVLFFPEEGTWDNNNGRNYRIRLPGLEPTTVTPFEFKGLQDIAEEIIDREMSRNSWTLMHRFNLCYDLLDKLGSNNPEGMALIFVWLRFSAIRQLDWQRNYNTKPRELGHAMDRLTLKLADRYTKEYQEREIIRLILTTLGRGSNAQRVRDEVLNIMHRHHIKEVSGHFMEEWHQKLHNNTTPDDIVICEAYLEFLRSDGNLDRFYSQLEEGGVSRDRLESYERPIKSKPDFIPHLKEALIRDFEHFLGILKEVHSGTDLGVATRAARYLFDEVMHGLMDFIWAHQNDQEINTLQKKVTAARRRLAHLISGPSYKVRDLLFLDIALEDFLRTVLERKISVHMSGDDMVEILDTVLENICLSYTDLEFQYTSAHWRRLKELPRFGREWSLHAGAALERISRALGLFVDRYSRLLQPKAKFLGKSFQADSWTISLFSEEVLRGRLPFILSLVARYLDPLLRRSARLGNWQLISKGEGKGQVKVLNSLMSVQGRIFTRPMVLIADMIEGDEEIPTGVIAIVTPSIIDSLSHLAIRARNAGILFAICYDPEALAQLKSLDGRPIRMSIEKGGDIFFEESREEELDIALPARKIEIPSIPRISVIFTDFAISLSDFNERNVGYKSNKLRKIQEKLPPWFAIPPSVAIPFGVFENVLSEQRNREVRERHEELTARIKEEQEESIGNLLSELRKTVLCLEPKEELFDSLRTVMEAGGLPWPSDQDEAWMCIKKVWASKWNDRAYLSRKANRIPHDALLMSVLIQKAVEADYSFVIHTVNPFTGASDEIYAEVVPGLGETLAANYPGRALSFSCKKGAEEPYILSFPSKSIGIYGGGLIFRSDSNGEDLAGYAGAGLYDSFVIPQPRRVILDYTKDKLLWDDSFQKDLLISIAKIGMTVEDIMGSPQDIEGAYSRGQYFLVQTRPQVGLPGA